MANILDAFKEDHTKKAEVDVNKKVRIGIIGTGWIADAHIAEYKKMPDVEIVAGADLVPGKAEAFFKKHGVENVRCYLSHKEMLDAEPDLDAVSICTYNRTHAECAIYSLKKGVNVLLEKPFTVTLDEAVEVFRELYKLAYEDAEALHNAPVNTPVGRLDEVRAARTPVLKYEF